MEVVAKNFENQQEETKLMHGYFFFIDIIGLSDPDISAKTQVKKIEILKKCILGTDSFKRTSKKNMLIDQHGDGMSITFFQGPQMPLRLAIELQAVLENYNRGRLAPDRVNVRIGLNSGICYVIKDLNNIETTWGPGIVLAKRVMDLGDKNHILLTPNLAESLREISDEYKKIIKPVHDFQIKHGQSVLVYSAYGKSFGNKNHPLQEGIQTTKFWDEISKINRAVLYPNVNVELKIIDPKTMAVEHKRTYNIKNISNEPINDVIHYIGTDVEKQTLDELNVRVYDEYNKDMKISSITVDQPTTKEFTTKFNQPVLPKEDNRKFTLQYMVEEPERFFENAFFINIGKFTLKLKYPKESLKSNPKIFKMMQENEKKIEIVNGLEFETDEDYIIAKYSKEDNEKGEIIRIEW